MCLLSVILSVMLVTVASYTPESPKELVSVQVRCSAMGIHVCMRGEEKEKQTAQNIAAIIFLLNFRVHLTSVS